jgi:hypothetical protein
MLSKATRKRVPPMLKLSLTSPMSPSCCRRAGCCGAELMLPLPTMLHMLHDIANAANCRCRDVADVADVGTQETTAAATRAALTFVLKLKKGSCCCG